MSLWIQITSGKGPSECAWVVGQLSKRLQNEASRTGLVLEVVGGEPGEEPGTFHSLLLELAEGSVPSWLQEHLGTIRWVGKSPWRPTHKRRNWHVGVSLLVPPETMSWNTNELRFETLRASGPGGQHVNKTESAVRVTHVPTGLSTLAQEGRSQHQNRRIALARLGAALREREEALRSQHENDRWRKHQSLERGNPVRVYRGKEFTLA